MFKFNVGDEVQVVDMVTDRGEGPSFTDEMDDFLGKAFFVTGRFKYDTDLYHYYLAERRGETGEAASVQVYCFLEEWLLPCAQEEEATEDIPEDLFVKILQHGGFHG